MVVEVMTTGLGKELKFVHTLPAGVDPQDQMQPLQL